MFLSIVYFPKFCCISPMQYQCYDVSRQVEVKVEGVHPAGGGETLLVLVGKKGSNWCLKSSSEETRAG